jgi:hypothetical protein
MHKYSHPGHRSRGSERDPDPHPTRAKAHEEPSGEIAAGRVADDEPQRSDPDELQRGEQDRLRLPALDPLGRDDEPNEDPDGEARRPAQR